VTDFLPGSLPDYNKKITAAYWEWVKSYDAADDEVRCRMDEELESELDENEDEVEVNDSRQHIVRTMKQARKQFTNLVSCPHWPMI
jgi:hypothetical protein